MLLNITEVMVKMLPLPSYIQPRTDKIFNVHSHPSTTLTPFNSDFPSFRNTYCEWVNDLAQKCYDVEQIINLI